MFSNTREHDGCLQVDQNLCTVQHSINMDIKLLHIITTYYIVAQIQIQATMKVKGWRMGEFSSIVDSPEQL